MKHRRLYFKYSLPLLALVVVFWLGVSANAQNMPPQNPQAMPPQSQDNTQAMPRDNDTRRWELASFDQFMDRHPEVAEQVHRDPSLVNNEEFVEKHPALKEYLQQHPEVREEIRENPNVFMRQEQRFDRREDDRDRDRDRDTTRRQLASFDQFMDSHHEIAEQLRKNPSLMDDREFAKNHPALAEYLEQHPGVREEIRENPNAFMRQEQRFDRREDDRDRDTTRRQLASFDQFMDSHREIAEQVRKNPSLVDDREFVKSHPALQEYLEQHPGVREEIRENPNAFMRQEQRFDQHEDRFDRREGRDHDTTVAELTKFGDFLGDHSKIDQQLSKNPSLVNNKEYMENHPELQQYLQAHPGVQEELKENPQAFMQSVQQLKNNSPTRKNSNIDPKSKQKQ
jgi:hypothetical protein